MEFTRNEKGAEEEKNEDQRQNQTLSSHNGTLLNDMSNHTDDEPSYKRNPETTRYLSDEDPRRHAQKWKNFANVEDLVRDRINSTGGNQEDKDMMLAKFENARSLRLYEAAQLKDSSRSKRDDAIETLRNRESRLDSSRKKNEKGHQNGKESSTTLAMNNEFLKDHFVEQIINFTIDTFSSSQKERDEMRDFLTEKPKPRPRFSQRGTHQIISEMCGEDYAPEISEPVQAALDLMKEARNRASQDDSDARVKKPLGLENVREDEKGVYFDEIMDFLSPFMVDLTNCKVEVTQDEGMDVVIEKLRRHVETYKDKKDALMRVMNVNRLIVPYISLDLPGEIILTYNKMEENDPLVAVFRLHPLIGEEVYKFGIFLDRYDTNKEALCSLVWSTIDCMVICLPMVGLNPYPVCWNCEKHFGTYTCSKCGVAKYCSKECQVNHWSTKNHKVRCKEMQQHSMDHNILTFT